MKTLKKISNKRGILKREDTEFVREITQELAKIMRVLDWNIEVAVVGTKEMLSMGFESNVNGCYIGNRKRNVSHIYLNFEADELQEPFKWYGTLVHEMKHVQTLEFNFFLRKELEYIEDDRVRSKADIDVEIMYESLIDKLAEEFVAIYPLSKILTSINPTA